MATRKKNGEMATGKRIEEWAKEKNMSLMQVAKAAGIPYNTVYSIVKGKSDNIAYDKIVKIAAALGISELELITGKTEEEIEEENRERWLAVFAMRYPLLIEALNNAGITITLEEKKMFAEWEDMQTEISMDDLEKLLEKTQSSFFSIIQEVLNFPIDER